MRILLATARRSATLPAGFIIAGLVVWLALSSRTPGLYLWSDLVTGLSAVSLYAGVIAAGFTAFQAGRWALPAQDRYELSARSRVLIRAAHAAGVLAPIIIGFVLGLVALEIISLATGTYGSPFIPWLLAFAAGLFLASAAGYAVGALLGGAWFVAPAAAAGFYALYVLTRSLPLPYGVKSLYPVITNNDSVFVRHLAMTMWGQITLWCALGITLVLISGVQWHRNKRSRFLSATAAVVLAGAAILGSATVIGTNGQYVTGYNSRDFTCESSSATLCLNRGYAAAMNPLLEQVDKTNTRAAGTPLVATRLEQNVEGVGDEPAPDARSIYVQQLAPGAMQFAVYRYLGKYGATPACNDTSDVQNLFATYYVDSWLSDYSDYDEEYPSRQVLTNLRALPDPESNAWFKANVDKYLSCTLRYSDFP